MTTAAPSRAALFAGVGCYFVWGFFPLLFHATAQLGATPWEMTAHRAVWAVFWAGGLAVAAGQSAEVRAVLGSPRLLGALALSALLIGVNWALFTYATSAGHTLEAALAYYINPLLNMLAGAALFRERLSKLGWAAVGLAAAGVGLQALALGHAPVLSLGMALSFAAYGIIRKRLPVSAQAGLFVECLILFPFGLAFVGWLQATGQGVFVTGERGSWAAAGLLFASGPLTVLALGLFAWAARRLPLSTMGFLQFIGPTLNLAIGLWQGEPFGPLRAASFGLIWLGAAVFVAAVVLEASRISRYNRVAEPT